MKYFFFLISILILAACTTKVKNEVKELSIVPQPSNVSVGEYALPLSAEISLVAKTEDEKKIAGLIKDFLATKSITGTITSTESQGKQIVFSTTVSDSTNAEGYSLSVNDNGVFLSAPTAAGLFYGAQTLIQIFPTEEMLKINLPFVEIKDSPRFAYRGLHLDVGRNMFPVEFIKKYIDLMAKHKFNRFHWHLTEDQGWRIEIKKYPRLQEISAYRDQTAIGFMSTRTRTTDPGRYDKTRYGGYYTQEEIKDVINYATDRYITIIPEIEMPGHALAALAAYPQLGCTGGPYKVAETWGIFDDAYCAGKEDTFVFLEDVLDEVIALFPSQYIHIGGDECRKTRWQKCPHCQKRIKTEKLKDEHELQSYFVQRIEKYLNTKGKQIIGWDEILEGGLAPNATVMSWRGEDGGIAAAKQNHDVIMSPSKWVYFDYYQDTTGIEPVSSGGFVPVKQVYSYEPMSSKLSASEAKHILGVQGNLWSEYIRTTEHAEYMVYPRACALAEVAWSLPELKSYENFVSRMQVHRKRLDGWHVNYAKHMFNDNSSSKTN